jgi:hypothetical protein
MFTGGLQALHHAEEDTHSSMSSRDVQTIKKERKKENRSNKRH